MRAVSVLNSVINFTRRKTRKIRYRRFHAEMQPSGGELSIINLRVNVHLKVDAEMVRKGVLTCCTKSLHKWSPVENGLGS